MHDRIWIVVPAYNEARVVGDTVATIRNHYPNVVVVDDGSRDDTAAVAFAAGANVVVHPINLGQGAALQTGLTYALSRGADHIVTFDADGQHDVGDIAGMIAALEANDADIAIGSRFLGSAEGMKASRKAVLQAAIYVTYAFSGLRLSDAHNGLRVMKADAAAKLRIRQNRMAHASELIEQIAERGLRYIEVPVRIRYTEYSKAKGQKSIDALFILKDLIVERVFK